MVTTMTIHEERNQPSLYDHNDDHILDWLEDTIPFLPSFFDDPNYNTTTTTNSTTIVSDSTEEFLWWDEQDLMLNPISNLINPTPTTPTAPTTPTTPTTTTATTTNLLPPSQSNLSKKRKPADVNLEVNNQRRRSVGPARKPVIKSAGNNCNDCKEGRWAEQLLIPCGVAIKAGNLTRVQHLLYVLHELASSSGDANHRLANYGLRALTHHLSSSTTTAAVGPASSIFASMEPRLFQQSLLKFYEVSPWFTFANTISNSSILQVLAQDSKFSSSKTLHILDIGVSHGIQWPTLLESLSRRWNGPTPVVRITVVNSSRSDQSYAVSPFSIGPPGDDYTTRLHRFAKSININLKIEQLNTHPLQILTPEMINTSPSETLIVCTQFRLHNLNHNTPNDERITFLQFLAKLQPSAVILSENDIACSCTQCGNFSVGFTRKVEYLWRFLESTSCAFKGRDCEERKVFEGEASKAIMSDMEMNDGREKWCEKMREVGFVCEGFGEDVIDSGISLLRKYDSNWEMKLDEKDGCVCLLWKGERVSFCSLWKLN
ncbi:hypothetical protein MKX01_042826 [Papaver californicum]|nr:hypothetical protein MKX01_042826 [Papaver californicum]